MHPYLHLGTTVFFSYGLSLVIGMFAGIVLAIREQRRLVARSPSADVVVPALVGCAMMLFGGRLWSLAFELYFSFPAGMSMYGRLTLGVVSAAIAARMRGLGPLAWLDVAAPGAALAIAFGSVGCLLSGCCYGYPTLFPIALTFDHPDTTARPLGVPLHATQLYEIILYAQLARVLTLLPIAPRGLRFASLALGCGLVHLIIEPLRADYGRTSIWAVLWLAFGVAVLTVLGSRRMLANRG